MDIILLEKLQKRFSIKPGMVGKVYNTPTGFLEINYFNNANPGETLNYLIYFCYAPKDVIEVAKIVETLEGDALVWIGYVKGQKGPDVITRDSGFEVLHDSGWYGVAMIALDPKWSLMRFRHRNFTTRRI